jgi:hypothetical protein
VPHAPLDVVDEPALSVERDDRDALAGDVALVGLDAVAGQDVFAHLADLHPLLAHLAEARALEEVALLVGQLRVAYAHVGLVLDEAAEPVHELGRLLDAVVLRDEDHVVLHPLEAVGAAARGLLDADRVVVELLDEGLLRHRVQHPAAFRVGLVLALRVEVEVDRGVGIEDRLDADALLVVVLVVFVLVVGAHARGAEPAADALLEAVVVGLLGA